MDIPGFQLIRSDGAAYRNYLFFGSGEPLYLYGSTGPGCPALPQAALARPAAQRSYDATVDQ